MALYGDFNDYHVFALEWLDSQLDWFVDNQRIYTLSKEAWFTQAIAKENNQVAPFDKLFYLMLNLAVGGNLPNNENEKTFKPNSFPAELTVDWVRVYQCADDMETGRKCMDID